jgi:hypothetical protein
MIQGTQIHRGQQLNRDRAEKTEGSIQTQQRQQPDNQRCSTRRLAGALAREKETLPDLTGDLAAGKLTGEENWQGPNEPSREQSPGSALRIAEKNQIFLTSKDKLQMRNNDWNERVLHGENELASEALLVASRRTSQEKSAAAKQNRQTRPRRKHKTDASTSDLETAHTR